MELAEQKLLAMQLYPDQWTSSCEMVGKKKRRLQAQLRKRAVERSKIEGLPVGAKCKNCTDYKCHPEVGHYCDIDSDFHGYQKVSSAHVCSRWTGYI